MMRLWMTSYAKRPAVGSSAALSAVVHIVLIGAAVMATADAGQRLQETIEHRVHYLPPPDHVMAERGPSETLRFVAMPPIGRLGFDKTPVNPRPSRAATVPKRGEGNRPMAVAVAVKARPGGDDSVMSVLQVDSTVKRYLDSASPAYPPDLLAKDVEGSVYTEYVVDTTGYADTASLVILSSTHPEFTQAVREALPYMRFHPAKIGNRKVRQLVEQQFTFKIRRPTGVDTTTVKRSGAR